MHATILEKKNSREERMEVNFLYADFRVATWTFFYISHSSTEWKARNMFEMVDVIEKRERNEKLMAYVVSAVSRSWPGRAMGFE